MSPRGSQCQDEPTDCQLQSNSIQLTDCEFHGGALEGAHPGGLPSGSWWPMPGEYKGLEFF